MKPQKAEKTTLHARYGTAETVSGRFVVEKSGSRLDKALDFVACRHDAFRMASPNEELQLLFEKSYELSASADLLFNLGQAYSRWYEIDPDIEHLRKARKLYQNYITRLEAEGDLTNEVRAETEERIADVERQIDEHERARPRERPTTIDKPVYKKGWFWGTIAGVVVVAGAVTTAVLLTRNRDQGFDPELGTIQGTGGRRPLGLRF